MQGSFISFNKSLIHYVVYGHGEQVLLCLHGFAESTESFSPLLKYLTTKYTVVLVDMPLHGETIWKDELTFTVNDLAEIIRNIPAIGIKNFSLLGYSMGGRIALQLYQFMPQKITKLILVAPDGIIINVWYRLATQIKIGNKIFNSVMRKPDMFFSITQILKKTSLINAGVYKYVHQHLKTEEMRSRLYNIWTVMRKMKPDIPVIKRQIVEHKTPVLLIYGRYDKVIRFTTGEQFCVGMEDFCTLRILESGHRLLHEKSAAAIAAEL